MVFQVRKPDGLQLEGELHLLVQDAFTGEHQQVTEQQALKTEQANKVTELNWVS